MTDSKETGQYAYEAYAKRKGWRTNDGFDMWSWELLHADEQDAWREAAHAAIREGWVEAAPAEPAHGRHASQPLPSEPYFVPETSSPSRGRGEESLYLQPKGTLRVSGKPSAAL